MTARAAAAAATRERVLVAAERQFRDLWYDDVTIRGVAQEADVAVQTVLNHFASKEELYAAASARMAEDIASTRWQVAPGDVDAALTVLLDDYEARGDTFLRTLAVEERLPVVQPTIALGRQGHERWCEEIVGAGALRGLRGKARKRRVAQLVVATDVYTWKLLRRDRGMTRDETWQAMRDLVLAVLDMKGPA